MKLHILQSPTDPAFCYKGVSFGYFGVLRSSISYGDADVAFCLGYGIVA